MIMARTSKRRAGGLARVSARQSRLTASREKQPREGSNRSNRGGRVRGRRSSSERGSALRASCCPIWDRKAGVPKQFRPLPRPGGRKFSKLWCPSRPRRRASLVANKQKIGGGFS